MIKRAFSSYQIKQACTTPLCPAFAHGAKKSNFLAKLWYRKDTEEVDAVLPSDYYGLWWLQMLFCSSQTVYGIP